MSAKESQLFSRLSKSQNLILSEKKMTEYLKTYKTLAKSQKNIILKVDLNTNNENGSESIALKIFKTKDKFLKVSLSSI